VGEIEDDGEDHMGMEPEEMPLVEGQACPACGLPLTAQWLSREALDGESDGLDQRTTRHPKPPRASWADRAVEASAHKPRLGSNTDAGSLTVGAS
jgi:hypothetical protein